MTYRSISIVLFFTMLLPAADIRSTALKLPSGTPLRVQTRTRTIERARLQSVTDDGISVLVVDGGALKEQHYRYAELRYLERRSERMSAGQAALATVGITWGISLIASLVLVAASR